MLNSICWKKLWWLCNAVACSTCSVALSGSSSIWCRKKKSPFKMGKSAAWTKTVFLDLWWVQFAPRIWMAILIWRPLYILRIWPHFSRLKASRVSCFQFASCQDLRSTGLSMTQDLYGIETKNPFPPYRSLFLANWWRRCWQWPDTGQIEFDGKGCAAAVYRVDHIACNHKMQYDATSICQVTNALLQVSQNPKVKLLSR